MSGLCLPASLPHSTSLLPPVLLTDLPLSGIPAASDEHLLPASLSASLPRLGNQSCRPAQAAGLLITPSSRSSGPPHCSPSESTIKHPPLEGGS